MDGFKLLKKLKKKNLKKQKPAEQTTCFRSLGGAMLRIINLLNQKNHFLEKFYTINETELLNFSQGNFDNLEHFYQSREKILSIIRRLDDQIDIIQNEDNMDEVVNAKQMVQEALLIKEEYVNRILAQDLEVLACIEKAKSNMIRELQELRRTKRVVGSYKSKITTNRLDEEV
jgi:hypothetical protein